MSRRKVGRPRTDPKSRACRHCRYRVCSKPRGLCRACFLDPAIRSLYPPEGEYQRRGACRGVGLPGSGERGLPEPTGAAPGTEDKLVVLCERAHRGQALFHPDDPRLEPVASPRLPTARLPAGSLDPERVSDLLRSNFYLGWLASGGQRRKHHKRG